MSIESGAHRIYRFGDFELDLDREALLRAGQDVPLRPKSFAVLTYLVEHHGRLVTKSELLEAFWGHAYGTEGSLTQSLVDVRRALRDERHEIIRTVSRRGFIFELPVEADGETPARASGGEWPAEASRGRFVALLVLLAVVAVISGWWLLAYRGAGVPLAGVVRSSPPPNSIAVLPFEDMSPGGDQEYFGNGIAEELLHALTQVPGLLVTARTSSFALKGARHDIPTVARRLNVAHVLEGSVRKSGERLRVTAQLVDADSNTHLWSRTFDRNLGDVFAIQSDIARAVAEALQVTLTERQIAEILPPHDPQAYEAFLQGRFFWLRRGSGDVDRAEERFARAVELDPGMARAWVWVAVIANARMHYGQMSFDESMEIQREALHRALALNPGLAVLQAALAGYQFRAGDRAKADEYWQLAIELGRDDYRVITIASGWAVWRGEYDEAIELSRRAMALDPLSAVGRANFGRFLMAVGRLDEAEAELLKAQELSPMLENPRDGGLVGLHDELALVTLLQGRVEEAAAHVERQSPGHFLDRNRALVHLASGRGADAEAIMAGLAQDGSIRAGIHLAELHAYRGDRVEAFRRLESSFGRVDPGQWSTDWDMVNALRISPLLAPLRDDPRWDALWKPWHEQGRM